VLALSFLPPTLFITAAADNSVVVSPSDTLFLENTFRAAGHDLDACALSGAAAVRTVPQNTEPPPPLCLLHSLDVSASLHLFYIIHRFVYLQRIPFPSFDSHEDE
jgi:hypothetical protein